MVKQSSSELLMFYLCEHLIFMSSLIRKVDFASKILIYEWPRDSQRILQSSYPVIYAHANM